MNVPMSLIGQTPTPNPSPQGGGDFASALPHETIDERRPA
jgi:hypothetical protein